MWMLAWYLGRRYERYVIRRAMDAAALERYRRKEAMGSKQGMVRFTIDE